LIEIEEKYELEKYKNDEKMKNEKSHDLPSSSNNHQNDDNEMVDDGEMVDQQDENSDVNLVYKSKRREDEIRSNQTSHLTIIYHLISLNISHLPSPIPSLIYHLSFLISYLFL